MSQSLTELWSRVLADDPRSWEQLVRRYNPLIIAVARAHGLAAADLEDCAQQTWLALYTGRTRIQKPASIPSWLVRVAKRKAQRVQLRKKSSLAAEEGFDPDTGSISPEEVFLQAAEAARLYTALEMMDPRCRRLLELLFLSDEEWSYQDIARDLGISPNSLGPIRSRCLTRLRRILKELGSEVY